LVSALSLIGRSESRLRQLSPAPRPFFFDGSPRSRLVNCRLKVILPRTLELGMFREWLVHVSVLGAIGAVAIAILLHML
jgi:hypothetical protein